MTFKEFFQVAKEEIELFEEYWGNHHKNDSKNFPKELEYLEWKEQLEFFLEGREV